MGAVTITGSALVTPGPKASGGREEERELVGLGQVAEHQGRPGRGDLAEAGLQKQGDQPPAVRWGLAVAPAGWGQFGGDLLVASNNPNRAGLTEINAYNLKTRAFKGTRMVTPRKLFSVTELWAISFGNGAGAGSTNTLFFTAGLANNTGGLLGAITPDDA
jgi:hypothetical protein